MIKLKSTSAVAARQEAKAHAPCNLQGYDKNGEAVYLSHVREAGNKCYVATAMKEGRAVRFTATPVGKPK